jgi:hypothetical protein
VLFYESTNATVVDDAIRFTSKSKDNEKTKSEGYREAKERSYNTDEGQLEEKGRPVEITSTMNNVF